MGNELDWSKYVEDLSDSDYQMLSVLNNNPEVIRILLKSIKDQQTLQRHTDAFTESLLRRSPHFTDLLKKHLPKLPQAPYILFLGPGDGREFLHARQAFPDATLVGIDKKLTTEGVLTEAASGAEYIVKDFTLDPIDQTVKELGVVPDVVITRHPEVAAFPQIRQSLLEWGSLMQDTGGKLLVTTYSQREADLVIEALQPLKLPPQIYIYDKHNNQRLILGDNSITVETQDHYVITS